jgi:hypothetical protein
MTNPIKNVENIASVKNAAHIVKWAKSAKNANIMNAENAKNANIVNVANTKRGRNFAYCDSSTYPHRRICKFSCNCQRRNSSRTQYPMRRSHFANIQTP